MNMGRPKTSVIDILRTRLWLAEMLRVTGSDNINQLGDLIDDVDTKKLLYSYANGKSPVSRRKLADIDRRIRARRPEHAGGESFFVIGPKSERATTGFAPLWDALDGPIEKAGQALVSLDPAVAVQKYQGVSFRLRCGYLIYSVFGEYEPPPYWENLAKPNQIARRYRDGEIDLDIDLITFAIAMWRMANFIGELRGMMNYVMVGLLERAIPETLEARYRIEVGKSGKTEAHTVTITNDLLSALEEIARKDLDEAEEAIKDLNYYTPSHPLGQLHDYRFLLKQVRGSNVAVYLARRRARLGASA
jgi:hypothetical protein